MSNRPPPPGEQLFSVGVADLGLLGGADTDLVAAARGSTKAGSWILPTARERIDTALVEAGYRVGRLHTEYTTQRCHICGELADVGSDTIRCDAEDWPVDRVCRDRSAAVSIARTATGDV